ncbi:BRCT domain-containing protein [Plasmodiophora brassicae]
MATRVLVCVADDEGAGPGSRTALEDLLEQIEDVEVVQRMDSNVSFVVWQDGTAANVLRRAKVTGASVVSPAWVLACHQQACVVAPDQYIIDATAAASSATNKRAAPAKPATDSKRKATSKQAGSRKRPAEGSAAAEGNAEPAANDENQCPGVDDEAAARPEPKRAPYVKAVSDDEAKPSGKKEARRKTTTKKQCSIALSQVDDFVRDAAEDLAKNLPGYAVCDSVDFTHLVVGKAARTVKVFYAIARGAWILSSDWILQSLQAGKWLPPESFEFDDLPGKASRLANADGDHRGMFAGELVFVDDDVEPPKQTVQELFLACGAQIVQKPADASVCIGAGPSTGTVDVKWLFDSLIAFKKLDREEFTAPGSPIF